jgi:hypothetical protein
MLMINNHFTLFQLPGNLLKTKKCAPYFRGNTKFPIYFHFTIYLSIVEISRALFFKCALKIPLLRKEIF